MGPVVGVLRCLLTEDRGTLLLFSLLLFYARPARRLRGLHFSSIFAIGCKFQCCIRVEYVILRKMLRWTLP